MSKVQNPEELAQELSASLTRCVPGSCAGGYGSCAGGYVAWVGEICESPWGCYMPCRAGYTPAYSCVHMETSWAGGWEEGRKTRLAMDVSPSLSTPVPGLWA